MEIKLSLSTIHWERYERHTKVGGLILAAAILIVVGWKTYGYWADKPLPPEQVTARRLRVVEGTMTSFQKRLEIYRAPSPVGTIYQPAFLQATEPER